MPKHQAAAEKEEQASPSDSPTRKKCKQDEEEEDEEEERKEEIIPALPPHDAVASTSTAALDKEGSPVDDVLQSPEGGKDVSQNKNPNLWCIPGMLDAVSSSSSGIWGIAEHLSVPANVENAVDDPMFWGSYLSERQWGTVREDYSPNDNSWEHVGYEDATYHMYVSGEDGLLGVCDKSSLLCMAMALWNGKDPILKERLFGLTGKEGNHGEDVKELYYYLDNLPDHSYMRALYKYPMSAFPYKWLREENRRRSFQDAEFELIDTGVLEDGGHWDVQVEYAKTDRLGLACHLEVTNCGRHEEVLTLIPQFWLRHIQENEALPGITCQAEPQMKAKSDGTVYIKYFFGNWRLILYPDANRDNPTLLFTDNQSPVGTGEQSGTMYFKDAFHQYVVEGNEDAVNPMMTGTKCGALYKLKVAAGAKTSVYWRIENVHNPLNMSLSEMVNHFVIKRKDASDYYIKIFQRWNKDERNLGIQCLAGLFFSKIVYNYDLKTWLRDYRRCRENKGTKGRNSDWSHVRNHHILMMPDTWEFPWYAGWDLCISAVLCARFDAKFAKEMMLTFLSDDYMHPSGQLPGCEFDMGDPNPPLQAWAVMQIYQRDGSNDVAFLRKCVHRLSANFTWFCNREYESTSTYGRGFMGMDNISVIDRSGPLPPDWNLVQADYTGWVACYALWMLSIVVELGRTDLVYCDMISRYLLPFLNIASAINRPWTEQGLWHEEDRWVYDVFRTPGGSHPICLRSIAGLVPLLACRKITLKKNSRVSLLVDHYLNEYPQFLTRLNDNEVFFSVLPMPRVQSILDRVFSEDEFFGPYGIRSLSKVYEGNPFTMQVNDQHFTVKYTPGESESGDFGGNSNWRGPVWIFMNHLLLESFDQYMARMAPCCTKTNYSLGPLQSMITLLENRLVSIFMPDKEGRRPVHGNVPRYATDPKWRRLVLFYEFIHADTGRGCGASHQTGWTAAILEIIYRLHR